MILLQTLGTLDLKDSSGAVYHGVLAQPRRMALLVHLAVATPHGFQRRDRLLALFWPEHRLEQARASLNRAIYFLRRELGGDVVVSRGHEEIGLNRDRLWCDAAAFDDAVDQGHTYDALELYRGDLLPAFFASNARGFEEWLEVERMRLRERAAHCAWSLASAEESRGNLPQAAFWARRGVEFAPFREIGLRRLLALLDRAGDRASAAHEYQRFADALADELELVPSPETRALIDAIRVREPQRAELSIGVTTANAATDTLSDPAVPASDPIRIPEPSRARRRSRPWPAAALAIFGLAITFVSLAARKQLPIDPGRIDVLVFDNMTGDRSLDPFGRNAAQHISKGLRTAERPFSTTIVEKADWRNGWRFIAGTLTGSQRTRAAMVISGTFKRERSETVVEAWITDTRMNRVPWTVAPAASVVDSLDDAIQKVATRVLGGVGLITRLGAQLSASSGSPPTNEAFLEFAEGLRLQTAGQYSLAADRFRMATVRDSTFTWPLVYAAQTSMMQLQEAQTDSLLAALNHVRQRLPALQLHLLDYLQATRVEDWSGRHDAIRQAAKLAPAYYGLAYAMSAQDLNRPRETIDALSSNGLDTLLRNDTRGYWRALTGAWHQLDEHRNELAAARRARAHRPESLAALMEEIIALVALGRIDAVSVRLDTIFLLPRDGHVDATLALQAIVGELRAHGQVAAANEASERAIAWLRARPAEEAATQVHRSRLGDFLYRAGHLDQADSLFQRLAAEYPNEVDYLGYLGSITARRGQREQAKAIAVRIESMQVFVPGPGQSAIVWRAIIAALLGQRDRALSLLTDAFGPLGAFEVHAYSDFDSLRDEPRFREFIRAKD